MNKKTLIWVIVLVIAGLFVWMMVAKKNGSDDLNTTGNNNSTSTGTTGTAGGAQPVKNTFPALFTQAGSHKCTYDQISPSSRSNHIIYIADGKMRGEFRTVTANKSTSDLMVYNGSYLYTWQEGTSVGKRTLLKSVSELPDAIPKDLTSGAIIGTSFNSIGWDCHDWSKDNTLLAPPTYVKFN